MIKVFILGMLKRSEMHGYRIQEELKMGRYEVWGNINPNSIYNALRTLEKKECIRVKEVIRRGKQAVSIYEITERGLSEYSLLLKKSIRHSRSSFPSDLYIGFSFLLDLSEKEAISAIEERIDMIRSDIAQWEKGESRKVDGEGSLLGELFNNGLNHLRADLNMLCFVRDNLPEIQAMQKSREKELYGEGNVER